MSHESTEIHTWKCDWYDCKEKLTAGGDKNFAREKGWQRFIIMRPNPTDDRQHTIDLCPTHIVDFMLQLGIK